MLTTSQPREYIDAARSPASAQPPMFATACAVCGLRGQDPFENQWFEGEWMPRWQLVIIEGMMLHSIAEATAQVVEKTPPKPPAQAQASADSSTRR